MGIATDFLKMFDVSGEPVLAASEGTLIYMNGPARRLFGDRLGQPVSGLLPEALLLSGGEPFSASTELCGAACRITAMSAGGVRVYAAVPEGGDQKPLPPASATARMLLEDLNLSIERLTSIVGGSVDDMLGRTVMSLKHSSLRLVRMITNLTETEALRMGTRPLSMLPRDMERVCSEMAETVSLLAPRRRIGFSCEGESFTAVADVQLMELLLYNLITNSLQHTGEDGNVDISLRRKGGSIVISVSDDGSGIPEERLGEVFSGRETDTGAGVGLALAQEIAAVHGGSLLIESRAGKGTRVVVTVPAAGDKGVLNAGKTEYKSSGMGMALTQLSPWLSPLDYVGRYED